MNTKVLTVHVPTPLVEKIDHFAVRIGRSRGWIVQQALSAWVEQEEERHLMTIEAMTDVQLGQVIDHLSIQAWADSLSSDKRSAV